jgi:branched-chain amino acid aminotransferase
MSSAEIRANEGIAWMDGALLPSERATLHFLSHGLDNASCVFEGERVYGGRVFKLREHSERLVRSAAICGIALPYDVDQICRATIEVVAAQALDRGYVRPVAWKGAEALGIAAPNARVHLAIAALPLGDVVSPEQRRDGIRLKITSWRRAGGNLSPVRAKASAHYLVGGLALDEARRSGYDDALLLDPHGGIAEATGANFFAVSAGRLVTPPTEFALDGITRRTVIELAQARGIPVDVRPLRPEERSSWDEAFLTGTASELLAVGTLEERVFAEQRPICAALHRDYQELVGR